MKKYWFVVLVFISTLTAPILAQQKPTIEMRKEKLVSRAQRNTERINLTPEQKPVFEAILDKYAKMKREINKSELPLKKKQDSVDRLFESKDIEVKKLLNAEQFKIYKEIVDERKQKLENARKRQLKVPVTQ